MWLSLLVFACAPQPLNPVVVDPAHDWDGDGFTEIQGDCDDALQAVSPDATEVCDNDLDDDCDGVFASCDADQDGVTTADGDCDDGDARVFPGAIEVCGNGIDESCTGDDALCAWAGDLTLPGPAFTPGGGLWAVGDLDGAPGPDVAWAGGFLDVLSVDTVSPTVTLYPWATLTNDVAPNIEGGAVRSVARLAASPRLVIGVPSLDDVVERGAVLLNELDWTGGTTPVSSVIEYSALLRGADGQRIGSAVHVLKHGVGAIVALGGEGEAPVWMVPSQLDRGEQRADDVAVATLYPPFGTPRIGAMLHGADIDGDGDDELAIATTPFTGALDDTARVYVVEAEGPDRVLVPSVDGMAASGPAQFTSLHLASDDLDGDGYEDLIVGFYADDPEGHASVAGPGAVHVHLGSASPDAATWLGGRTLSASDWVVSGDDVGGWFGAAVEPAGDVDGDGVGDLWVASPLFGDDDRGAVTLVAAGSSGVRDLVTSPEAVLARVQGGPAEFLGSALMVDDFTLDGAPDLLLSSSQALYIIAGGPLP